MLKVNFEKTRKFRPIAYILFVCLPVFGVLFFYQYWNLIENSQTKRSEKYSEVIVDHGKTYYITKKDKKNHVLFKIILFTYTPATIIVGWLVFPRMSPFSNRKK